MICSHAHQFIFIKTTKTAGTSIEMALEQFCAPDDIVTPIWGDGRDGDEGKQARAGRNYRKRIAEFSLPDWGFALRRRRAPLKFANHEAAATARTKLPAAVWDGYLKFAVVRNPWDRAVSIYYWATRAMDAATRPAPMTWFEANHHALDATRRLCCDGDEALMDVFVRYETLATDLDAVGARIGLPTPVSDAMRGRAMKTSQRPRGADYRTVLDTSARDLIAETCRWEIERFGYAFDAGAR